MTGTDEERLLKDGRLRDWNPARERSSLANFQWLIHFQKTPSLHASMTDGIFQKCAAIFKT